MGNLCSSHTALLRGILGADFDKDSTVRMAGWLERAEKKHPKARLPKCERPRCNARTRAGGKCKAKCAWLKGEKRPRPRCRMHGGASTGPVTLEGKQRSARNLGLLYNERTRRFYKPK